eukprot:gene27843-34685_t
MPSKNYKTFLEHLRFSTYAGRPMVMDMDEKDMLTFDVLAAWPVKPTSQTALT